MTETHDPMREILENAIRESSQERLRPDGSPYQSITFDAEREICLEAEVSHGEVQRLALELGIVPERYSRNQKTISCPEQLKLLNGRVAIIGQGGLGGTVTEILARIGVGHLTLVDGDHFEDSNLNRQLLSNCDVLGQMKAEVGAERVQSLNPAVETRSVCEFFSRENGKDILNNTDIAVDCLDSIPDRFLLEDICRSENIILVSAAIGGTSGQASVIFPEDPGLKLVYGPQDTTQRKGVEASLGTLPYAAIAMAAIECAEVVSLIISGNARLRNKLLFTDFNHHTMDMVSFE